MIVRAARGIAPDDLTMQAVATELGVDRKALNHYVEDRQSLLLLVAADAFSANFATVQIAPDSSWQDACRSFAHSFAASLIETGLLVEHFRLGHSLAIGFLKPADIILRKMVAAGFADETAARLLLLLANICISYARDCRVSVQDDRALARKLRTTIDAIGEENMATISRILEWGVSIDSPVQLALCVDVFLAGANQVLATAE